ncbi:dockerin type I domain-containing protein [Humisphaera borealis]|uniref:Dockerin domain-containing protein n=1 Tax=Humisphaera borealis TaxID=2807512 RepID=A0A7M2WWM1_9BACT|nr:dockerin type I domain-containing protein [Humisphaera borealis]QOV88910.1 hypothetical protein IPV69_22195 [Humisphaera borealis]
MNPNPETFSDDALPPALLAGLRSAQRTPVVPAAVDARVRNEARAYFARQRRARVWLRVGGSIAAAVLVVVGVRLATSPTGDLSPSRSPVAMNSAEPAMSAGAGGAAAGDTQGDAAPGSPASPATRPTVVDASFLRQDIDRSGRVDILDAFTVARGVKTGKTAASWDANGDGVIDQRDVDQIAAIAVRVKGGVQ